MRKKSYKEKRRAKRDKNKKTATITPIRGQKTIELNEEHITANVRVQPLASPTEPGRVVIALIQLDNVVAFEDERLPRMIALLTSLEERRQKAIEQNKSAFSPSSVKNLSISLLEPNKKG